MPGRLKDRGRHLAPNSSEKSACQESSEPEAPPEPRAPSPGREAQYQAQRRPWLDLRLLCHFPFDHLLAPDLSLRPVGICSLRRARRGSPGLSPESEKKVQNPILDIKQRKSVLKTHL